MYEELTCVGLLVAARAAHVNGSVLSYKTPRILWNLNAHSRVHNSPSRIQMNTVNAATAYLRPILILSSHLRLRLLSDLFLPGFPTKLFA
jgi:hypothetical protein